MIPPKAQPIMVRDVFGVPPREVAIENLLHLKQRAIAIA
jgi:hypothetical protein